MSRLWQERFSPVSQRYVPPKDGFCAGTLSGHRRSIARSRWTGSFSRTWCRWTWRYSDDWTGSWWSLRSGSRVCTTVRLVWFAASFPVPLRDWACCRRRTSPPRWSCPFSAAKSANGTVREDGDLEVLRALSAWRGGETDPIQSERSDRTNVGGRYLLNRYRLRCSLPKFVKSNSLFFQN